MVNSSGVSSSSSGFIGYASSDSLAKSEASNKRKVVIDGYEVPVDTVKIEFDRWGTPKAEIVIQGKDVQVTDEGVFVHTRHPMDNIEKLMRMGGKEGQLTPLGEKIKGLQDRIEHLEQINKALTDMYHKSTVSGPSAPNLVFSGPVTTMSGSVPTPYVSQSLEQALMGDEYECKKSCK